MKRISTLGNQISAALGMDRRTLAAVVLLVISVGSSISTGLLYSTAKDAQHRSEATQAQGRSDRKLTDLRFCRAINQGRQINNRDRLTFIRSRSETENSLKVLKDPTLRALLVKSLENTKRELAVRPYLTPLPCVRVIQHPTGTLPTGISTTPVTTTN